MTTGQAAPMRTFAIEEEFGDILPRPMALNIKDPAADALVRELAATTGESITTAVTVAVRERLERVRGPESAEARFEAAMRIAERAAARPVLDHRTPDEILGYDERGLPT
jgi:antitoxin VapB